MKYLLVISSFICSSIFGCTSYRLPIIYHYQSSYTIHKLILKKDSTFTYMTSSELNEWTTHGKFDVNGNCISLSSDLEYLPYNVKEIYIDSIVGYLFELKDTSGYLIPGNYISMDDNIYYTNDAGKIRLDNKGDQVSYFTIYGLKGAYNYKIRDINSNVFIITYDLNDYNNSYFLNELFCFKGNALINKRTGFKLTKVKTELSVMK